MNEFLEENYSFLVTMTSIIYCMLGFVLIFFNTPQTSIYAPYRKSKRLLATGMLIMSIDIWIWLACFNGEWTYTNDWEVSFDTILFYLVGICFSFSFSNLINHQYISKRRCKITAIKFGATSCFALFAMLDALQEYRPILQIIALLGIVELCFQHVFYFHRTYLQYNIELANYFSSDQRHFLKWLNITHWLLYILFAFAVISTTSGAIINWLLQFYIVAVNFYITINFINHAREYGNLQLASERGIHTDKNKCPSALDTKKEENAIAAGNSHKNKRKEDFRNILRPRLALWLKEKAYTHEQFTIEELAALLYTNKTYLATFIQEEYGMSFSSWISSLRIEEAKRIMANDPQQKLIDVAYNAGFSSLAYFSSVFAKSEGISPSAWLRGFSRNSEGEQ